MTEWKPFKPVSWFLGLEVINALRGIALDALQHDFNLRDWMQAKDADERTGHTDCWFDFLADTGDGGRALMSLAYHLQRDITITTTTEDDKVAPSSRESNIACGDHPALTGRKLPRGRFLFVGGDFAYPQSDMTSMWNRVLHPFAVTAPAGEQPCRPIYGIPANHDYYDDLIGFNRVIRAPIAQGHVSGPKTIAGYVQSQQASYVRILLPHDWEFWGVDVGTDGIDFRQLLHLRPPVHANQVVERPKRLIICTQKPPIVLDGDHTDKAHRAALQMLALSTKFEHLANQPLAGTADKPDLLDTLECRLDLSGDVHHYARYGDAEPGAPAGIPLHRFAGVVSGGGGAFLHPTSFTAPAPATPDPRSIVPRHKYPTPAQCTALLARGHLTFFRMVVSGQAWILAGLVALAIYAGSGGWSGWLTALPHRWFGSPTSDFAMPCADLAMALGFVGAIGLPIVWLVVLRPRLLGKRSSERILSEPAPGAFDGVKDSWDRTKQFSRLRDLLDASPVAALIWVSLQIPLVIGLAIAPPWIAGCLAPGATMTGTLAVIAFLLFAVGGIVLGAVVSHAKGLARVSFGALGAIHGAIQITVPLIALLYGSLAGAALVIAMDVACSALVIVLAKATTSAARPTALAGFATLLWIAQGIGAIAILAMFAPAHGHTLTVATGLLAIVIGVVVCIHQFGWYLFVSYLWGGHNNEAGAAVRCEDYKQWIRFHIGTDGVLTGYVIGVDRAVDARTEFPKARIVDVFQLGK